ncbi:MAG: TlpA family protein disulfide reductase [Bacteroidales bacterium]
MIKKLIICSTLLIVLLNSCKRNYTSKDYLDVVLDKLNKIESASYFLTGENWNPGDTSASFIFTNFINEYKNPSDTTIGAKYVSLDSLTKSKADFCYDGKMRALFYNDEKVIVIDSFTARPLPFRPLSPPFYNYVTSIVKYALTTRDSISTEIKEQKSNVFVRLTINEDEQIEFFGKAYHMPPSPYNYGDNTSIYELWIDKKTDLPYKIRREMSHNISVSSVSNFKFNELHIKNFIASDYFPKDYEIEQYRQKTGKRQPNELIGKKAPDWTLQTDDNQNISLSDLKSEVLLIQFTSVSCGPCRASIPFLKELQNNYKKDDFDFVAIESTCNSTNSFSSYKKRNQFNYKFLLSNKQILKDYSIQSYPVFFILDKNRIIKEVVNGYGEGTTDDRIKAIINELIQ